MYSTCPICFDQFQSSQMILINSTALKCKKTLFFSFFCCTVNSSIEISHQFFAIILQISWMIFTLHIAYLQCAYMHSGNWLTQSRLTRNIAYMTRTSFSDLNLQILTRNISFIVYPGVLWCTPGFYGAPRGFIVHPGFFSLTSFYIAVFSPEIISGMLNNIMETGMYIIIYAYVQCITNCLQLQY